MTVGTTCAYSAPRNSAFLPSPLSLSCPSDCSLPLSRRLLHFRKLLVLPARCPPRPRPALVPLTRSPPLLVSVPHMGCANDHLSHRSLSWATLSMCGATWTMLGRAPRWAARERRGRCAERERDRSRLDWQTERARLEMGSTRPQEGAARQGCEGFAPTAACLWQALLRLGCIAGPCCRFGGRRAE